TIARGEDLLAETLVALQAARQNPISNLRPAHRLNYIATGRSAPFWSRLGKTRPAIGSLYRDRSRVSIKKPRLCGESGFFGEASTTCALAKGCARCSWRCICCACCS